jgi:hypothetical protein
MSDREEEENLIRNEDTLRRRAWIDRAVASVRQRLAEQDHQHATADRPERGRIFVMPSRKPR